MNAGRKISSSAIIAGLITGITLSCIQVFISKPLILGTRFNTYIGWLEIVVLVFYSAFIVSKMTDPKQSPFWRKATWTIFAIAFFGQLILGIMGIDECLMTGKLHLPIPAMILCGPIYRFEFSIMPILFISTLLLSGPAWCSQLCYFGATDNLVAASGKIKTKKSIKNRTRLKFMFLFLFIISTLSIRFAGLSIHIATIVGGIAGIIGVFIILIFSGKEKKMIHCTVFCPIGTIVNYLRFVSPFRFELKSSCTHCMKCTSACRYDALNIDDINRQKIGNTCTLCGDCLSSCPHNSLQYKLFGLKPETARLVYITTTVCLHTIFLALARI